MCTRLLREHISFPPSQTLHFKLTSRPFVSSITLLYGFIPVPVKGTVLAVMVMVSEIGTHGIPVILCETQHVTKATSIVQFLLLQVHLSLPSPLPLSLRFSRITWQLAGILAHHSLERLGSFGSIFNIAWPILCRRTPCRHICAGIVGGFICRNMPVACSGGAERSWCPSRGDTPFVSTFESHLVLVSYLV